MLGREERDQLEVLVLRDEVDRRTCLAVDGRVVGNQSDALAADGDRHVGEKHIEAGMDLAVREGTDRRRRARARGDEKQGSDESLHGIVVHRFMNASTSATKRAG